MTAEAPKAAERQNAFSLKGSTQTVLVMYLAEPHLLKLTAALKQHFERGMFDFDETPLMLDLSPIEQTQKWLDFPAISALLGNYGLKLFGVRAGNETQRSQAREAGLALFAANEPRQLPAEATAEAPQPEAIEAAQPDPTPEARGTGGTTEAKTAETENIREVVNPPLVIRQPVRSGTEPYAHARDMIVEGPVSPGARVMSDGSIYIHGPLRGSAAAGARGLPGVRIFCEVFEPEIVAINGVFMPAERLAEDPAWGRRAVVEMTEEGKLSIRALS
ncbi:MAG: septum site-determining protein MinC [Halothiobacillaceae bacterium]